MLILVPTAVGVFLSGARVVSSIDGVNDHRLAGRAAEQAGHLRDLAQALGLERDAALWWDSAGRTSAHLKVSDRARADVDRKLEIVHADLELVDHTYGDDVTTMVKQVFGDLDALENLRETRDPARYSYLISDLLKLHEELERVTDEPTLLTGMRGLVALAKVKEEVSVQRVNILLADDRPEFIDEGDVERFVADRARQADRIADFGHWAGVEAADKLMKALGDEVVYRVDDVKKQVIQTASVAVATKEPARRLLGGRGEVKEWFEDNTKVIGLVSGVEKEIAADLQANADALADDEQRNALVAGASILALLVLVLLTTVLIARSLVSPLRHLRSEALEIAGFRLPDVVRNLRLSNDAKPPVVSPIELSTEDEIAEVAQAFDEVHRQAVRLAAEEAGLRSNINSMFVNLSRRTQTLVERQIALIDRLEKGEQDGGRLSDLFKLDHLATRMRRNSENLLVLAGHEHTRRRSQPAKLVDVVRASLSEVEDYERVQVKVHRATAVIGSTANDIVHLVAELVENAIQFSPRHTQVLVGSSLIEGGAALLTVADSGIGMTQEELAEANRRLSEPPVVDVSVSRRMGLFVVGRLALRHGIRVQLRPGEGSGVVAMVLLPASIVVQQGKNAPQAPLGGRATAMASSASREGTRPFGGSTTGPFAGETSGAFSRDAAQAQPYGGSGGSGALGFPSGPLEYHSGPQDMSGLSPGSTSGPHRVPGTTTGPQPILGEAAGSTTTGGLPRRSPRQKNGDTGSSAVPSTASGSDSGLFSRPGTSDSGAYPNPAVSDSGGFSRHGVSDSGVYPNPALSDSGAFPMPGTSDSGAFPNPAVSDSGGFPMPGSSDSGAFRRPGASDSGGFSQPGVSDSGVYPNPALSDSGTFPTSSGTGAHALPTHSDSGPFRLGGVADTGGHRIPGPADSGPFRRTAETGDTGQSGFSAWTAAPGGAYDSRADSVRPGAYYDSDPDTASMPAVDLSPMESEGEFLPIFASVESAWFRRADSADGEEASVGVPVSAGEAGATRAGAVGPVGSVGGIGGVGAAARSPEGRPATAEPADGRGSGETWETAADAGWQAAAAASRPTMGGVTAAGLPKRTPKANLVPGTAALGAPTPVPQAAPVSADRMRERMSGFQQGVRRGRAEIREESAHPRAEEEENS
ncbi:Signal transduction histidine kinase [Sinosporangium album]|uniref:histidine kinase n=1 Tax=Sinosporangium album TaxID=504805 RepID=A0A1G7V9W4_9ACTN|nr:Signal transduction histidine kinase [Sinosporangium album]